MKSTTKNAKSGTFMTPDLFEEKNKMIDGKIIENSDGEHPKDYGKHLTKYIFRKVDFAEMCNICDALENDDYRQDFNIEIVDIVDGRTGEVYALRDALGLWEINI